MTIKVSEAIELGLIEHELAEIMPMRCEVCDTELSVSESIVHLLCDNRECASKISARLESMAKAMKVDGWGEASCRQVVIDYKLKSPYQIFLLENKDNKDIPAFSKKIKAICDIKKRNKCLWEIVQLASIPHIDSIAFKIFDGYDSLGEAFTDIEKLGPGFIADRLGLKDSKVGVMAVSVYNTLIEYKDELLFGETQFTLKKTEGDKLKIVITGGVYGYNNKSEFIEYINNRYAKKVNAMQMNSVTKEANVLIVDEGTNSKKYKKAKELKDKGHNIMIVTGKELIEYLDDKYA